jgi:hypothetical protein
MPPETPTPDELAQAALDARNGFLTASAGLTTGQRDDPNLVGDWGLREIIAHLGYWVGMAGEALHQAEQDRAGEFGADDEDVDERNEIVARVAREASLATAQAREEAAFNAMLDRLQRAGPAWLLQATADGSTIGSWVQDEAIAHYREHAAELLVAIKGPPA